MVEEERFQKKLGAFKFSNVQIPKGVLEKLDYCRSRLFWQCDEHKKKYKLARWSILHKPKSIWGGGG
jgi:hypothetical protein